MLKQYLKAFVTITFFIHVINLQSQDFLKSATSLGTGITSNNSASWSDLTTTTIDVTGVSKLLVTASINMRPDGTSTIAREANYRIYTTTALPSDNSGVIKRELIKNSELGVESWGIGTLVYIFDVSGFSGDISFILEHSNQAPKNENNVYSSARLTAVALTTALNGEELSNDIKSLTTEIETSSSTFEQVTGLTTSTINLPFAGDVYVVSSINSKANGNSNVGEYMLEYSSDNGSNWFALGKPVKRTMINNFDNGIISLVGLLPEQTGGSSFLFRLMHRRVSGSNSIVTSNVNLVAVGLSHSGGRNFPAFISDEVGSSGINITGVSTPASVVTTTSFNTPSDIGIEKPDVFVSAQFLMSASNLDSSVNPDQRMRGSNQLFLFNGAEISGTEYFRYIPDNDNFGSGGTIGLLENLDQNSLYALNMKHHVANVSNPDGDENETLTTSEVILTGFQLFDELATTLSSDDYFETGGIDFYSVKNKIEFRSNKPINANIRIFNILGQEIKSKSIGNVKNASLSIDNYYGIVIVSIETLNKVFSKKMIINGI